MRSLIDLIWINLEYLEIKSKVCICSATKKEVLSPSRKDISKENWEKLQCKMKNRIARLCVCPFVDKNVLIFVCPLPVKKPKTKEK